MRRFQDYDPFAWLYTHHWAESFHDAMFPVVDKEVLQKLQPHAAVLDLCCGDGRLSERLEQRGFRVTGLDGSEEMLSYAQQRCPKTHFVLGDARAFTFPQQFDAVVCTFDSLNHVPTINGLRKVFENVRKCLKKGGVFLFDLNEEISYLDVWGSGSTTVKRDVVSVARGAYDEKRRLATCDVTVFRWEKAGWTRSDFQMRQKFHSRASVLAALEKTGFRPTVEYATLMGMQGHYAAGRSIYIAR